MKPLFKKALQHMANVLICGLAGAFHSIENSQEQSVAI
jgi:hypothetical protein